MSYFHQEERYVVIKLKNYQADIPEEYQAAHIRNLKDSARDALVECVVVESDWPIYEETWENVQRVVEGQVSIKTELAALKEENEGWRKISADRSAAIERLMAEGAELQEENERLKARVADLEKGQ